MGKRTRFAEPEPSDDESTSADTSADPSDDDEPAGAAGTVAASDNSIYFFCNVTTANVLWLQLQLDRIGRRQHRLWDGGIWLYINSDGGVMTDGLAAHDLIVNCRVPVTTIVVGTAGPAAAVMAQAGATRAMTRHAQIIPRCFPSCRQFESIYPGPVPARAILADEARGWLVDEIW